MPKEFKLGVVEDRILNGYNNKKGCVLQIGGGVEDRILNGYNNSTYSNVSR